MKLRNSPDPKDNTKASKMPIKTARTKAVDTEDNCFLSAILSRGLPLARSPST